MYSYANRTDQVCGPAVDHIRIKAAALQAKTTGTEQLWIYLEYGRLIFAPARLEHLTKSFVGNYLVDAILLGLTPEAWNVIDHNIAILRAQHHNN